MTNFHESESIYWQLCKWQQIKGCFRVARNIDQPVWDWNEQKSRVPSKHSIHIRLYTLLLYFCRLKKKYIQTADIIPVPRCQLHVYAIHSIQQAHYNYLKWCHRGSSFVLVCSLTSYTVYGQSYALKITLIMSQHWSIKIKWLQLTLLFSGFSQQSESDSCGLKKTLSATTWHDRTFNSTWIQFCEKTSENKKNWISVRQL